MTTRRCSLYRLFCRYDISQLTPSFGRNPGPAPPRRSWNRENYRCSVAVFRCSCAKANQQECAVHENIAGRDTSTTGVRGASAPKESHRGTGRVRACSVQYPRSDATTSRARWFEWAGVRYIRVGVVTRRLFTNMRTVLALQPQPGCGIGQRRWCKIFLGLLEKAILAQKGSIRSVLAIGLSGIAISGSPRGARLTRAELAFADHPLVPVHLMLDPVAGKIPPPDRRGICALTC
jgi:hypothetical protein